MPQINGFGDYSVKNNSLMFGGMTMPMISNSVKRGGIIIRHREYIGDLNATASFTNRNFPLNPGLVQTFPWLAQVANAFEQYRWRGLIFEFKSNCADALLATATDIGMGSVIMATQYNALSPGFSSKIEMENYEFANSAKPSRSFMHPVECALNVTPNTPLYIRSGAIPDNSDERLYDLGNFCIATQGIPGTGTDGIGEIWATFEIELFKPKFNPDHAEGLGMDHFTSPNPGGVGLISAAAPMGDLTGGYYNGNIGGRLRYVADGTASFLEYDFPPEIVQVNECFQVSWLAYGAAASFDCGQTLSLISVNGFNGINTLFQDTTTHANGLYQWSTLATVTPTTSRRCHLTAFIKATLLPPGQLYTIRIQSFGAVCIPADTTLFLAVGDLYVTRVPAVGSWRDAQGPQNVQEFGL